jgi:hypothetical protein
MSGAGTTVLDLDVLEELDEALAGSPQVLAAAIQSDFFGRHELGCACSPIELREERDGTRCARCDVRLRRRA